MSTEIILNGLSSLLEMVQEGFKNPIRYTIECDDKVGRMEFIKKIRMSLENIKDEQVTYLSLQNLMSTSSREYSGIMYKVGINEKNAREIIADRAYKYQNLYERRVYVLSGVKEFIEDYRKYREESKSYTLREKQIENMILNLTSMTTQNFIIIEGTTDEINSLLGLDSRIQFVYGNNRIQIPAMSVDDMWKMYYKDMTSDLIEELRENKEKYEKEFKEYVEKNKAFLPISNMEIVKYLVTYATSKDKIVFPEDIYKKETVEESLRNIVGLKNVKEKLKEFEKFMLFKARITAENINVKTGNMHMIFTGNPGTGKTTIARIMAKMLFDMGMIKENKLIEVERKDLVAQYVGQTAIKTAEVIDKARGGVLFIDEAYTLSRSKSTSDFGTEAIDTLIKSMEDLKDELVVIFAGYRDEMRTFVDANPGIASRIGYNFEFQDYTPSELLDIFFLKIRNMGLEFEKEIETPVEEIIKYFSKEKNFGNARFIDKLFQVILMKHAQNESENIKLISLADIPTIEEIKNTNDKNNVNDVKEMMNEMVGMTEVKEKVLEFEDYVEFVKKARNNKINIPIGNMHMIFTGNPGTGKTTFARVIAKLLFEFGIVHENKLIEVERKDLIGEYIGQTAVKTTEVIDRAMGGVLFIDEAYTLSLYEKGSRDFGAEAIATLIKAMEDKKEQFVVIFAGYKNEMKGFIESNPGIASRIGYVFDFPNYTAEELTEIFKRKIEKMGFKLEDGAIEKVIQVMRYFRSVKNFGNGRFVDKVVQETIMNSARLKNDDVTIIRAESVPAIKEMTEVMINGNNMISPDRITEQSIRKTAIHEVGHATIAVLLFEKPGIERITVSAEGTGTLGYVRYENNIEDYTSSRLEIENRIKRILGGMAAEKVFVGEFENGNSSDLEKATYFAECMVTKYGMSDLGLASIDKPEGEMAIKVYDEVNKILDGCFKEAIRLIEENKDKMQKVVDYLLEHKEISEEEFLTNFN